MKSLLILDYILLLQVEMTRRSRRPQKKRVIYKKGLQLRVDSTFDLGKRLVSGIKLLLQTLDTFEILE